MSAKTAKRTPTLAEQLRDTPEDLHDFVLFLAKRLVGDDESERVTDEVTGWIDKELGGDYEWPGNVRELEQCVRNVLIHGSYRPAIAPV